MKRLPSYYRILVLCEGIEQGQASVTTMKNNDPVHGDIRPTREQGVDGSAANQTRYCVTLDGRIMAKSAVPSREKLKEDVFWLQSRGRISRISTLRGAEDEVRRDRIQSGNRSNRGTIERVATDLRDTELYLGGLGTSAKILWDRVPPEVEPFSPDNLLIFSAGLLCGTPAIGCNRTIVSTVSPQTLLMAFSMMAGFWRQN